MNRTARFVLLALTLGGIAACDTYGDRYPDRPIRAFPERADRAYPAPPSDEASPLHQDRPGGSDYNPYSYRR